MYTPQLPQAKEDDYVYPSSQGRTDGRRKNAWKDRQHKKLTPPVLPQQVRKIDPTMTIFQSLYSKH